MRVIDDAISQGMNGEANKPGVGLWGLLFTSLLFYLPNATGESEGCEWRGQLKFTGMFQNLMNGSLISLEPGSMSGISCAFAENKTQSELVSTHPSKGIKELQSLLMKNLNCNYLIQTSQKLLGN
jgi:hypothetical protein